MTLCPLSFALCPFAFFPFAGFQGLAPGRFYFSQFPAFIRIRSTNEHKLQKNYSCPFVVPIFVPIQNVGWVRRAHGSPTSTSPNQRVVTQHNDQLHYRCWVTTRIGH